MSSASRSCSPSTPGEHPFYGNVTVAGIYAGMSPRADVAPSYKPGRLGYGRTSAATASRRPTEGAAKLPVADQMPVTGQIAGSAVRPGTSRSIGHPRSVPALLRPSVLQVTLTARQSRSPSTPPSSRRRRRHAVSIVMPDNSTTPAWSPTSGHSTTPLLAERRLGTPTSQRQRHPSTGRHRNLDDSRQRLDHRSERPSGLRGQVDALVACPAVATRSRWPGPRRPLTWRRFLSGCSTTLMGLCR